MLMGESVWFLVYMPIYNLSLLSLLSLPPSPRKHILVNIKFDDIPQKCIIPLYMLYDINLIEYNTPIENIERRIV